MMEDLYRILGVERNASADEIKKACTSLTKSPELPATTRADSCYYQMFSDCTALKGEQ